jgi:flavonoid 3'-monooxygenase
LTLNFFSQAHGIFIVFGLQDFTGAGVDTSASTLEWALLELIRHPDIMKKAQEELDRVVGRNRPILESDLPNLPYLQAVIKENFRLHPTSPVAVPHLNTKDSQISNYNIPANTIVILNVWAIGRDPKTWNKPLEFDPDRFVDSNISVQGTNYGLLPFGSGRRQCPGLDLAQLMVQYGLATMIHAFDWFPQPNVKPKDMNVMENIVGFISRPTEPLVAVARLRLPSQVYKGFI